MGEILLFLAYIILGGVAIVATYFIGRLVLKCISHFFVTILPEYVWHNLAILLFVGILVGGIALLVIYT